MTHVLENNYTRHSHTVVKALGPTTDFPIWGSGKGTENPQGIWRWRPKGCDYRISTGVGKQTLGGHKQNLVCTQDPEERSSDPTRDWARLARECQRVFSEGMGQPWPAGESEALNIIVLGAKMSRHKSFWRELTSPSLPLPHFGLRLNYREGTQPNHQQKIGLTVYWVWPHQSEQDPDSPTASHSHQEASTKILCLSILRQTEWKPQSQKSNQTYHMEHNLV